MKLLQIMFPNYANYCDVIELLYNLGTLSVFSVADAMLWIYNVKYKWLSDVNVFTFTPSRRASPPFDRYSLRLPTKGWPG